MPAPYKIHAEKTRHAKSLDLLSGAALEHRRADVNAVIKTACPENSAGPPGRS